MNSDKKFSLTVVVLIFACALVVIFAFISGAAYTSVQQARRTAAEASLGQIEAVLALAEKTAEESGLGTPPESYQNLLKSYDTGGNAALPPYERFILNYMMEYFGGARGFDFAVARYLEGTEIYFFPVKGATNTQTNKYYLLKGGNVTEGN